MAVLHAGLDRFGPKAYTRIMRRLLFHIGMLAGITVIVFFGTGFLSLMAEDPVLTAVVAKYGPNGRMLALVLLWLDTVFGLTIALGSALMGRRTMAPTRRGPMAAAIGYILLIPTFAWAALDSWNTYQEASRALPLLLPGVFCLAMAVVCLIQWNRAKNA